MRSIRNLSLFLAFVLLSVVPLRAGHHGNNHPTVSFFTPHSNLSGDPFEPYYQIALNKSWGRGTKSRFGLYGPGMHCAQYVKDILIKMGCIDPLKRPGNMSARDTDKPLRRNNGFTDAGTLDPCKAKIGAVIIYEGTGAGHAELKTPKGYLSDYLSLEPRTAGIADDLLVSSEKFRIPGYARPRDTYCKQTTPPKREFERVKAILMPPKECLGGYG